MWAEEELKNWDTQQRYSGKLSWCNPLYQKTPDCRPQTETVTAEHLQAFLDLLTFGGEFQNGKVRKGYSKIYTFFFRSVTAVIPFCSISKTTNQFQSDAIYQTETTGRGS